MDSERSNSTEDANQATRERKRIAATIFRRLGLNPEERLSSTELALLDGLYEQFRRDANAIAEGLAAPRDELAKSAEDPGRRAQRCMGTPQRKYHLSDSTGTPGASQDPALALAVDETRRRASGSLERARALRAQEKTRGDHT